MMNEVLDKLMHCEHSIEVFGSNVPRDQEPLSLLSILREQARRCCADDRYLHSVGERRRTPHRLACSIRATKFLMSCQLEHYSKFSTSLFSR